MRRMGPSQNGTAMLSCGDRAGPKQDPAPPADLDTTGHDCARQVRWLSWRKSIGGDERHGLSPEFIVEPGSKVKLDRIDASYTGEHQTREHALPETEQHCRRLRDLQYLMYAEDKRSLLVWLQGMDAGGKDGTDERLARFRQRLDDPARHWKISEADYAERGGSGTTTSPPMRTRSASAAPATRRGS
jgi:hypothetical protein